MANPKNLLDAAAHQAKVTGGMVPLDAKPAVEPVQLDNALIERARQAAATSANVHGAVVARDLLEREELSSICFKLPRSTHDAVRMWSVRLRVPIQELATTAIERLLAELDAAYGQQP